MKMPKQNTEQRDTRTEKVLEKVHKRKRKKLRYEQCAHIAQLSRAELS